jgi:hypothetical protein
VSYPRPFHIVPYTVQRGRSGFPLLIRPLFANTEQRSREQTKCESSKRLTCRQAAQVEAGRRYHADMRWEVTAGPCCTASYRSSRCWDSCCCLRTEDLEMRRRTREEGCTSHHHQRRSLGWCRQRSTGPRRYCCYSIPSGGRSSDRSGWSHQTCRRWEPSSLCHSTVSLHACGGDEPGSSKTTKRGRRRGVPRQREPIFPNDTNHLGSHSRHHYTSRIWSFLGRYLRLRNPFATGLLSAVFFFAC